MFEQDGEVVEGLLPVVDGHGPLGGRFANSHVHVFQGGLLAELNLPVPGELANHAVDRSPRKCGTSVFPEAWLRRFFDDSAAVVDQNSERRG